MVQKGLARQSSLDPPPGTRIGRRYEVVRLLARGGVGVVYLARDVDTEREVVVKLLAPHLIGEPEVSARFDREVTRLSAVEHPNIVEVLDHGRDHGAPYLVMEYLPGESLDSYLERRGRLQVAEFVPIAAQVLKALGFAHARGLVHRDIKPANIMLLTRRGRANFVKLLDFGMAKLVEGERDITAEQILGTANYMAPEQIRGEVVDARVDVYACGVLFYLMLSGRLPFTADNNAALVYKHLHEEPPPLESVMPARHDAPAELLSLVDICLAKDPAERPPDANALTEELVGRVPSGLFRLPLADTAAAGTSTPTGSHGPVVARSVSAPVPDAVRSAAMNANRKRRLSAPLPATVDMPFPIEEKRRAPRIGSIPMTIAEVDLEPEPAPPPSTPAPQTIPRAANTGRNVAVPFAPPPSVEPTTLARGRAGVFFGLGLIALALVLGVALWGGGKGPADRLGEPTGAAEERRLIARLDQIDAMILGGDFSRATLELDALKPELAKAPAHRSRADQQRRRLHIATHIEVARRIEQRGDLEGARRMYSEVLALDPGNAEARSGLARLSGPSPRPPAPAAPAELKPGRAERPARPSGTGEAPSPDAARPVEPARAPEPAPVETPDAVPVPPAPEPPPADVALPEATQEEPIFLPVGG